MTAIDPNIPKLLNIKQKDQERRLAETIGEIRILEQKLSDLAREVESVDSQPDGIGRISVANGYLNYVQHRREALIRQIHELNARVEEIQSELRKSLHSQSMLQNHEGA